MIYKAYIADDVDWCVEDDKSITVHSDEDKPINTGILNAEGIPLYRTKQPIGFDLC